MLKKFITYTLIVCLVITGISFMPGSSPSAQTLHSPDQTVSANDTAYYDVWRNSAGVWIAEAPGDPYSAAFTFAVDSGLVPDEGIITDVSIAINHNPENELTSTYTVQSYTFGTPTYNSASNTISWSVSGTLPSTAGYDISRTDQTGLTVGYRYYIPVTITITYHTETVVPDDAITAALSGPASVPAGETITVSDASFVPDTLEVDYAQITVAEGSGSETNLKRLEGSGSAGVNTGGSADYVTDTIGIVHFGIIVYDTLGRTYTGSLDVNVTDGTSYEGRAELLLPVKTYINHPTEAEDSSTFTVNGENYSAYQMYTEDLASHAFVAPGASQSTSEVSPVTNKTLRWGVEGDKNVTLNISVDDGARLSANKTITVLPTPDVNVNLTGDQRENRKQRLEISIATNPQTTLSEVWVQIETKSGGESVRLIHHVGNTSANTLVNSDNIKTRAIQDGNLATNEYFTHINLDFLTKFGTETVMKYTIYAREATGTTDTETGEFTVAADQAPDAQIELDPLQIREEGKQTAKIQIKDMSTTDGDQLTRTWYYTQAATESSTPPYAARQVGGTEYVVSSSAIGTGSTEAEAKAAAASNFAGGSRTFTVASAYTFSETTGQYYLTNPTTVTITSENFASELLPYNGHYTFFNAGTSGDTMYRLKAGHRKSIANTAVRSSGVYTATYTETLTLQCSAKHTVREQSGAQYTPADSWLPLSDYTDQSFGSKADILANKTGVGKYYVKLVVTDSFSSEETLQEYITAEDLKSDTAYAMTDVQNVAPKVSLSLIKVKKVKVLMMARTDAEYEQLKANKNTMKQALAEQALIAEIDIVNIPHIPTEQSGNTNPVMLATMVQPHGYIEGGNLNGFPENYWYTTDDKNLYTVSGQWSTGKTAAPYFYSIAMPYTITCRDIYTNTVNWTITATSSYADCGYGNTSIVIDDMNTYLMLRGATKTALFNPQTGNYLTTIDIAVGEDNYYKDGFIYTLRPDGIWKISVQSGTITRVYSETICSRTSGVCDTSDYSRRFADEIQFVIAKGNYPYRVSFNMSKGSVIMERLPVPQISMSNSYSVLGFDVNERVIVGIDGDSACAVFDADNRHIYQLPGISGDKSVSYDSAGRINYLFNTSHMYLPKKGYYNVTMNCYKISTGQMLSYTLEGRALEQYPAGGVEENNGTVSFCLAGKLTSISDGSGLYCSYSYVASYNFAASSASCSSYCTYPAGSSLPGSLMGSVEQFKINENWIVSSATMQHAGSMYGEATNNASVGVAINPKSLDSLLNQTVSKYTPGAGSAYDKSVVILYDNNQNISSSTQTETLGTMIDRNCTFINSAAVLDSTLYGGRFTQSLTDIDGKASNIVFDDDWARNVAAFIAEDEDEVENELAVDSAGEATEAAISKAYLLDPATTYYYEYDISNYSNSASPLSVNHSIDTAVPDGSAELNGNDFAVTDIYTEDFNDDSYNAFFTVSGARSAAGWFGPDLSLIPYSSGTGSRYLSGGGTVSFTVPEGKSAIIQFDYDMYSTGPDTARINIDGIQWENMNGGRPATTYTHPHIIGPGTHTLELTVRAYGTHVDNRILIDNLKVFYVEQIGNAQSTWFMTNKTFSGDTASYTAPYTGDFNIAVTGPHAQTGGAGGYIEGTFHLNEGDTVIAYLGNPAPAVGAGATGTDGHGYSTLQASTGSTYLSTVYINGQLAMVAGGGGSSGGAGANTTDYSATYSYWNTGYCPACGKSFWRKDDPHSANWHGGIGGAGGVGAAGGAATVTPGNPGAAGIATGTMTSSATPDYVHHEAYLQGEPGKAGGAGGDSYLNTALGTLKEMTQGINTEAPSITISGGEVNTSVAALQYGSFDYAVESTDNEWKTYAGSFKTPPDICGYSGQTAMMYDVDPNTAVTAYTTVPVKTKDYRTLTIKYPRSKTMIDINIGTYAATSVSGGNRRNVTFWFGISYAVPTATYYEPHVPNGFRFHGSLLTGGTASYVVTSTRDDTSYRSDGGFTYLNAAMVDTVYSPVTAGKYFLDTTNSAIELQNKTYSGQTLLTLNNPTSEDWSVRNLSVYTLDTSGNRIYLEDASTYRIDAAAWTGIDGIANLRKALHLPEEAAAPLIYQKGEEITTAVSYWDYETDPQQDIKWVYVHTPFNDGEYNENGYAAPVILDLLGRVVKINGTEVAPGLYTVDDAVTMAINAGNYLQEPINRSWTDGKYTAYVMAKDSTGTPAYDLWSQMAKITFYVVGGTAPLVGIESVPSPLLEGQEFSFDLTADDPSKSLPLTLYTDVYFNQSEEVWSGTITDVVPVLGVYPTRNTGTMPERARAGTYTVVCTVDNGTTVGAMQADFVVGPRDVTYSVNHTERWNKNRAAYNQNVSIIRRRGDMTYWSGEKIIATASDSTYEITGIAAYIEGTDFFTMEASQTDGEWVVALWDEDMYYYWGTKRAQMIPVTVRVYYADGGLVERVEHIVIDDTNLFYRPHKTY